MDSRGVGSRTARTCLPLEERFGRVAHRVAVEHLGADDADPMAHRMVQATLDLARGLGLADVFTDDSVRRRGSSGTGLRNSTPLCKTPGVGAQQALRPGSVTAMSFERTGSRAATAALAFLAVLVSAGCGSDDDAADQAQTAPSAVTEAGPIFGECGSVTDEEVVEGVRARSVHGCHTKLCRL